MIRPHRFSRALIVSSIFLAPVMAAITSPGVAYASSCNTVATGSWSNNCTVQIGNDSDMVLAAQVAATLESPPCFTNLNGNFDESTQDEVMCFQSAKNLQPDGIVGPLTWGAMQNRLSFIGTIGDWSYWTSDGCSDTSCANFRKWIPSGVWYVRVFGSWQKIDFNADTQ
jgi:hypothetical protein